MAKQLTETEELLIKAISDDSLDTVVSIVSAASGNVDLNCTDEHGMSPLQHACYKGNAQIAKYLIERGADVNQNNHEHRYTALMFAAIGGYSAVVNLLLEHGANVNAVNTVGRNASQMAAFVGQHRSVAIINNFISRDYIEYYSRLNGLEKEPRLPIRFIQPVHSLVRIVNINPVRLAYFLKLNMCLFEEPKKISNVLELLCEKLIRSNDPNEMFSLKSHYLKFVFDYIVKALDHAKAKQNKDHFSKEETEKLINSLIKIWLKPNSKDVSETMERLIRESIRSYPYQENSLFQQLVRTLATVEIGEEPSTLTILSQAIVGKTVASEDYSLCYTCGEANPDKRCSKCKVATYCDQTCQKMHWSVHKNMCDKLLEQHLKRLKMIAEEEKTENLPESKDETSSECKENLPDNLQQCDITDSK